MGFEKAERAGGAVELGNLCTGECRDHDMDTDHSGGVAGATAAPPQGFWARRTSPFPVDRVDESRRRSSLRLAVVPACACPRLAPRACGAFRRAPSRLRCRRGGRLKFTTQ